MPPTHDQVLDAAATIAVVVAAHLRQSHVGRRRERRTDKRMAQCAHELRELRRLIDRWSGLP